MQSTTEEPAGAAHANTLRKHHVEAMFVHHEQDDVVAVARTQELDAFLTAQKVKHTTLILPAGSHRVTDEVKALARSFIRRSCCSM